MFDSHAGFLPTLEGKHNDIIQLLAGVLGKDPLLLGAPDESTDQYVTKMIKNRLSHLSAYEEVKGSRSILELNPSRKTQLKAPWRTYQSDMVHWVGTF